MKRFAVLSVVALFVAAVSVAELSAQCCGSSSATVTYSAPMTYAAPANTYTSSCNTGCVTNNNACCNTRRVVVRQRRLVRRTNCCPTQTYTSSCGSCNTCAPAPVVTGCNTGCNTSCNPCCNTRTRLFNRRNNCCNNGAVMYSGGTVQSGCAGCASGTVIMDGTMQGTVQGADEVVTPDAPAAEATPPTPDDT